MVTLKLRNYDILSGTFSKQILFAHVQTDLFFRFFYKMSDYSQFIAHDFVIWVIVFFFHKVHVYQVLKRKI